MIRWSISWDTDYGIDHRWGWSIVVDGRVMVQLEHNFFKAVWRGWRAYRQHVRWLKTGIE